MASAASLLFGFLSGCLIDHEKRDAEAQRAHRYTSNGECASDHHPHEAQPMASRAAGRAELDGAELSRRRLVPSPHSPFDRCLSVRFLDLLLRCVLGHAQCGVVILAHRDERRAELRGVGDGCRRPTAWTRCLWLLLLLVLLLLLQSQSRAPLPPSLWRPLRQLRCRHRLLRWQTCCDSVRSPRLALARNPRACRHCRAFDPLRSGVGLRLLLIMSLLGGITTVSRPTRCRLRHSDKAQLNISSPSPPPHRHCACSDDRRSRAVKSDRAPRRLPP